MSGFALLQPLYLLGLAGAAVPIVIHLYGRRRRREVQFPSLQLLKATQQRQRSLVRLRSLLVLLLRILAIVLFVLALARPTARGPRWASAVASAPESVAIVLDDSLSMGLRVGGETVFDRALAATDAILGSLRAGDEAVVVPTSGDASRVPGQLTTDIGSLRETTGRLQPSQMAGGVGPAIARAARTLSGIARPGRQIYVVSDLQAASWDDVQLPREALRAAPAVTIVDVGAADAENWVVESAALVSPIAFADRPVRLRADIRRYGGEAAKRVAVWLGDEDTASGTARTVELTPGGSGSVELVYHPTAPGDVGISIRTESDALPADNRRFVALRVRDRLDVLCVEGSPGAARFLRQALSPSGGEPSANGPPVAGIHVTVAPVAQLSQATRDPHDLVVLANVPRLTNDQLEAVIEHAHSGAGLLVFLSDAIDAAFYNETLLPRLFGGGDLVELVRTIGDPREREGHFAITDFSTTREPLAAFAEPSSGDLSRIRCFALWEIVLSEPAAPSVLARFDNGLPAMLETATGSGRTIIVNITADDTWTNAPRRAAYVPLVHRLCYHVARGRRSGPASFLVGDGVATRSGTDEPGPLKIFDEAGEELPGRRMEFAGIHRAEWGEEQGDNSTFIAANVDPAESDPIRVSHGEAAGKLRHRDTQVVSGEELGRALRGGARRAMDLSLPLLLLALAALAGELLLSGRRVPEARGAADRARPRPGV